MKAPHVLVNGLVLRSPMGGALRYAVETIPRCARLLHERGGRLSVVLAQAQRDQAWVQDFVDTEFLHVDFVDGPMHPALRRALRETHALQTWIDGQAAQGTPVNLVQTQSLPIPRLRLQGEQVHLCHGLRRLKTGSALSRHFATALFHKGLRHVHSLLAVSDSLATELQDLFPHRPVTTAPPASDHRPSVPREPTAEAFVLCPGPIAKHKNHALLVEAWSQDSSLPNLHLYAEESSQARALQRQIQRLDLEKRILWHAPLDEASWPGALAQCAAVVLPSRLESFGMVALESLHAGAPLALSDLASHREVIGSAQQAAVFFSANDAKQCAAAIHLAIAQAGEEFQSARKHRARDFAWENTARTTVDFWCGLFG